MPPLRVIRRLAVLAALTAVYVVAGKLGLRLAFVNASATAVWPPTGIALSAFLLFGAEAWPAIFVGAFLVNVTTAGTIATSLGIALGNTLEGAVGAWLVIRFADGRKAFERAPTIFAFVLLAALLSTTVSATCGVTTLALGGYARWADFGPIWLTWWLGDATGDLVVAPAILLWRARPRVRLGWMQALEVVLLTITAVLAGLLVFGGLLPSSAKHYPLEFLCIPVFIWAAFRFGRRAAATGVLLVSGIAIWGTLRGLGPFVRPTQNESLLLLQAFMGVVSITTLMLAAVVAERRKVEERLRLLSASDPLTGLANYRELMAALEREMQRSQRTERPFALVLLDLDGLKQINDRHGHLIGSRALCRVAEGLRRSCRVIDTAARFGGDEFALVLPETDDEAARQVARRVAEHIAGDGEPPPLTVSTGVAVYPRDGETTEALISVADRLLYQLKVLQEGRASGATRVNSGAGKKSMP